MTQRTPAIATDRIRVCEGVSARDFDGDWVVLDLQRGNYFGLDEVGGIIWQNLITGKCSAEIAVILASTFDITEDASLKDVLCLVNELIERGLLQVGE